MPNDGYLCTSCYGSGYDPMREATCHCQPQPMPNEPSEAMSEKLEPLGPMMRCPSCGQRFQEVHDVDAHLARPAPSEDDKALVERLYPAALRRLAEYAELLAEQESRITQLSAEVERLKEAIAAVYGPSGPRIVKAAINAMNGPTDASE